MTPTTRRATQSSPPARSSLTSRTSALFLGRAPAVQRRRHRLRRPRRHERCQEPRRRPEEQWQQRLHARQAMQHVKKTRTKPWRRAHWRRGSFRTCASYVPWINLDGRPGAGKARRWRSLTDAAAAAGARRQWQVLE
jgi:hypothetical protein